MAESVLEFFPTDIGYSTKDSRLQVNIYGVTEEGKKVKVVDDSFEPCFYVRLKDPEKSLGEIRAISGEGFRVVGAELCRKKYLGEGIDVLKVRVSHPLGMQKVYKKCKEINGYLSSFGKDISVHKRYILEKGLKFFTRTRAKGELESKKGFFELRANSVENLNGETIDSLKILAFDIETYNKGGYSLPEKDPIIMISFCSSSGEKGVITTKRIGLPFVEHVPGEMELLKRFFRLVDEIGPDIIVGYNTDLFDFPYIEKRAEKYNMEIPLGWDRKGPKRVRRGREYAVKFRGLVHVDLLPFVRDILGPTLKTEVYGLDAVANEILGEGKHEMEKDLLWSMWENGGTELEELCRYSLKDAEVTAKLAKEMIFQMIELTRLVGLPMFDICRSGYSHYVDYYMMRNACRFDELIPNRPGRKEIQKRFRRTYVGAFVYEPTPGIYDNIVVMDFRSLYPSIIISHNISPDTLNRGKDHVTPMIDKKKYSFPKGPLGFFPTVLKNVLERRWTIKAALKNMDRKDRDYKILEARQYALKTVANAAYGYLGFPAARWYSLECAESITAWGREYIKGLIEDAKKKGFKVLYGDTDSVFFQVGKGGDYKKFMEEQNKKMPGPIELEFGDIYKAGIFVSKKTEKKGAKKKYALLNSRGEIEIKGFEYVRRDWAEVARECQKKVIRILLEEKDSERAKGLVKRTIKELRNNKVPLKKVMIYTTLKKRISEYKSISPHVAAAMRAEKEGRKMPPGTMIRYVVTKGEGSISDRSVLYETAKEQGLGYDPDYYINNQIIPSVEQVLDVAGIDSKEGRLESFFGG